MGQQGAKNGELEQVMRLFIPISLLLAEDNIDLPDPENVELDEMTRAMLSDYLPIMTYVVSLLISLYPSFNSMLTQASLEAESRLNFKVSELDFLNYFEFMRYMCARYKLASHMAKHNINMEEIKQVTTLLTGDNLEEARERNSEILFAVALVNFMELAWYDFASGISEEADEEAEEASS